MPFGEAMISGVKGIFTAHGDSKQELMKNPTLRELVDKQIIERIIFLKKNREFYVEEQSERNDNKVCL